MPTGEVVNLIANCRALRGHVSLLSLITFAGLLTACAADVRPDSLGNLSQLNGAEKSLRVTIWDESADQQSVTPHLFKTTAASDATAYSMYAAEDHEGRKRAFTQMTEGTLRNTVLESEKILKEVSPDVQLRIVLPGSPEDNTKDWMAFSPNRGKNFLRGLVPFIDPAHK